jgi:PAS domain S-box-containing protein
MEPSHIKVLLIEDDEDDALLTKEYLEEVENFHFDVTWESESDQARKQLVSGKYDIFLIDYRLGSENGLDLIKFIQSKRILVPSIILTGQNDIKVDIDASRYGASDYLIKAELNSSVLERSIRYALSQTRVIKQLDENEKKYRTLFERSIDPIFLTSDTLLLMDVNDSFLELLGYSRPEGETIILKSIFEDTKDYDHFLSTIKTTGQIRDFEVSLVTKSQVKKICLLNCVFIPDQAFGFSCYQGILHDLTQRKQAESEMLMAERLSLTGKMARTIAHEVRNPLTNLNFALGQLREELPADNQSVKLYAEIIERNANRIEQLVGEMLNSSRPGELHFELTEVRDILDATIKQAADRIKLKEIVLQTKYENDLPRILVDSAKIQIALLNIVINAVEAMIPGQGVLTIQVSVHDKLLTIAISDNGKGIAASDIGKIFDPFFTEKPTGMGLGLTSTKNILNSHNARVDVKSELTKGTTFSIHFRLAE